MLPVRTDKILKFTIAQYIIRATPVPSQAITAEGNLSVSSATVRNEMALLEEEGYISRPHTSAGAVPTDKGYRYYVDSIGGLKLPLAEQRLLSHLFHQVERRLEEWLGLAAALIARSAQNVAVVTMPKPADARFKFLELVSLRDALVLLILVLRGAKIKRQLIDFDSAIPQPELMIMANKLNAAYAGLNRLQIQAAKLELNAVERQLSDYVVQMMQAEDEQEFEEPYLEGWHFMLSQPEFTHNQRMLALLELIEGRQLLKVISPKNIAGRGVQVIIGKENQTEAIQDYSVVISQYGLPDEAIGTIGLLGPTRMPYARAIPTIDYLSLVLGELVTNLYGKERPESARKLNAGD